MRKIDSKTAEKKMEKLRCKMAKNGCASKIEYTNFPHLYFNRKFIIFSPFSSFQIVRKSDKMTKKQKV